MEEDAGREMTMSSSSSKKSSSSLCLAEVVDSLFVLAISTSSLFRLLSASFDVDG
jgi:hypothetical protein